MNTVEQKAYGANINQEVKIFNRPLEEVDICADRIESILKTISKLDLSKPPTSRLTPPDIEKKNSVNSISPANAQEIEKTYALWDDIQAAIASDAEGTIADNYTKSAYILNLSYLSDFEGKFPKFRQHVIKIYCQTTGADMDDALLLIHLIHYMYLSCQIGIKP